MTIDEDDFKMQMKLIQLESKLVYALSYFDEQAKIQLERMKTIKSVARILADHKCGPYAKWWKQLDPELKKNIRKYTSLYYR